jgi:protein-S-isoprenylcysteine O-methyltransferase Ste14
MKNTIRFLFGLVISFIALAVIPQAAIAFTYPGGGHSSSSGNSSWIIIPIAVFLVIFIITIVYQRRKAGKVIPVGPVNVSSVVQEKLLPGESPIRQLSNGRADYVATDKRLLRFSSSGFEQIEYTGIAAVNYKTSGGKKAAVRILIGFCLLIMLAITVGIWVASFDSSIRNVSTTDAIIVTIIAGVIGVIGLLALSRDFGFYQIESKPGVQSNAGSWRIVRPPAYFGNANVDEFIKILKEHLVP